MSTGTSLKNTATSITVDMLYVTWTANPTPIASRDDLRNRIFNLLGNNIEHTAVLVSFTQAGGSPIPGPAEWFSGSCLLLPRRDLEGNDIWPKFNNTAITRFFDTTVLTDFKNSTGQPLLFSSPDIPEFKFTGTHLVDNPIYWFFDNTELENAPPRLVTERFPFAMPYEFFMSFCNNQYENDQFFSQDWLDDYYEKYHNTVVKNVKLNINSGFSYSDLAAIAPPPAPASLAFVDLTDVTPLVPVTGQAVHYDAVSGKWDQVPELVVDPTTRDVISTTVGLFSQVSTGSASIGSIGAEANIQGQTGLNAIAITGDILIDAQAGDTNVEGQTGVLVQSVTGNTDVGALDGDLNLVANDFARLTANNEQVIITSVLDDVLIRGGTTLQNAAGTINKLTLSDTQITTSIVNYDTLMGPTSLTTKTYVDGIAGSFLINGGNGGGDVRVGTLGNNFLYFRTFGTDKMYLGPSTTNTELGSLGRPFVIGGFGTGTAASLETRVSGGFKSNAGGVGGNLNLFCGSGLSATPGNITLNTPAGAGFVFTGTSGLLSTNIANYETLVVANGDIPNKKYVDDQVAVVQAPNYLYGYNSALATVAVATLNTPVQFDGTGFADSQVGFTYLAGQWTYSGAATADFECTLSVSGFADIQDTRLAFTVFQNGSAVTRSQVISYAKNSITQAEGTDSRVFLLNVVNGDTIDIRASFIEDNSPNPNPTSITMEQFSLVIKQLNF